MHMVAQVTYALLQSLLDLPNLLMLKVTADGAANVKQL